MKIAAVGGGIALVLIACRGGSPNASRIPGDRGPAITVEVLNASGRAGGARVGTRLLREAGIDVVYFGNAPDNGLDTTRIIIRRGAADAGARVRAALGMGRVEIALDSTKLLDVSVLLGADFAAASAAFDFHP
ncbi:MAG TPA: LytR C-terminal domain-containing protein [Gemmatimonadales bacterium]|nr:LytR C-terminal domain-containing protein [Gemmatimonadales bacterium]